MRLGTIITLALAFGALACQRQDGASSTASGPATQTVVVAQLDGRDITAAELETWMKDDLYKREIDGKPAGEVYEAQAEAIDSLVDEALVANAAKRAGQTPDAFMKAQEDLLGPVTDAEVKAFFEQNTSRLPPGATLESLGQRIKDHLEQQRPEKVRETLRAAAKINVLLQPPRANVDPTGPSRGPADAPVVIVEFSDYQCPFCKRAEPTVTELLKKYPTQVRVVYRHMPLDGLHPRARPAAIASVCAEAQGKFWEYHDKLFSNQQALGDEDLDKSATELGLDLAAFKTCIANPETAQRVQHDSDAARAVGITGTPAFLINGILISGARPVEDFSKWIDQELAAKPAKTTPAAAPPATPPAS
jgi:protein-disulfide isomerase